MRCPKCKTTLVDGGKKEYQTLSEHVFYPNQERFPPRPTYVCPNQCFGKDQFFGYNGGSYRAPVSVPKKYWCALDSLGREAEIETHLNSLHGAWKYHASILEELAIEGERDIPPKWTWGFYWLRGGLYRIFYKLKRWRKKRVSPRATILA